MSKQTEQDESKADVGQSALNVELGGKFTPDWANYREGYEDGVNEAIDEVSRLCQDYCALNGSVFIKDVLNTLSVLKIQMTKPTPNADITALP